MKGASFLIGLFIILFMCFSNAFAQSYVSVITGTGGSGFSGDGGLATNATIGQTQGICVDGFGNLYISDVGNARIRKIDPSGIITTVAGSGVNGFSGDGGFATAAQLSCYGVECDISGNLYIGDWNNNRVRKIEVATGIITTICGTGVAGSAGDGGLATAAQLNRPIDACVDLSGNIYISEYGAGRIRKIDASSGIITTFAIVGNPVQIVSDLSGNVFVAQQIGLINKITPSGIITTIAGGGVNLASGIPATMASLHGSEGLAVDCAGNIFIADNDNNIIRKVDATGIIHTIAGHGTTWVTSGLNVAASSSRFHNQLICINPTGDMYCTDDQRNFVYKISNVTTIGESKNPIIHRTCIGGKVAIINNPNINSWTSDAPDIAVVDAGGVVTGISPGKTTITALLISGCTIKTTIEVIDIESTIEDFICVGSTITLYDGVKSGKWKSDNADILAIDSIGGTATGISLGEANITYNLGPGCLLSKRITVAPAPLSDFLFQKFNEHNDALVVFNNISVDATSYLWDFGDSTTSKEVNPTHQYTKTGIYNSCLTAYKSNSCISKTCKKIFVEVKLIVGLPTAFSPNGDGENDILYIRGLGIKEVNLKIYNRYGQLVFETNDLNTGWDGKLKGQPQPIETYCYVLSAVCIDGSKKTIKGNVTLLQ